MPTPTVTDDTIQDNQRRAAALGVNIPGVGERPPQPQTPSYDPSKPFDILTNPNAPADYQPPLAASEKRKFTGTPSQFSEEDVTSGSIQDFQMQREAEQEQQARDFIKKQDDILNGVIPLSPDQQAQVDGLKMQFQQLIDQQKLINTSATGIANTRGYQKGAAEYDATFQTNIINSIASAGVSKVASLQTQLASAVGELTQAFKSDNVLAAKSAYDTLTQAQDDYDAGLADYVKNVTDAINEQQRALEEQQKTEALRAKELQQTKNDIFKKLGTSGKDVPPEVYESIKNAQDENDAFIAAGDLLYSENDMLDAQYKRAQIAKAYHDISMDNSFGRDPSLMIAYANQYAATGQIPTGLPKGSFGVVAQIAKELPKSPGQIVSRSTGITPTGDTTLQSGLGALYSATELAKQLKELDEQRWAGIIGGTAGKVLGSDEQRRYMDLRSQVIDLLSRARSGAALTVQEEERYGDMLPGRFSEPFGFGADSTVRIDNFINALESDITNKASAQGWAVNGVSKVKIAGSEYKVGDILMNGDGQTGRINADGSVTVIQ